MNRIIQVLLLINFISIPLSYAGEDNVYSFSWLDPDKEVYVLQNRKFRKKGRVNVAAAYGMTTSGAFVDANTIQGRIGFFPLEEWGFEFLYATNSGEENEVAAAVRNEGGTGVIPFRRKVDNYIGGMLMWSPFYMKINTFNTILYVDWMIGLGYAKLTETNNKNEVINNQSGLSDTTESHGGILWGTALKFYITRLISVRADLSAVHYEASKILLSNTDESKGVWYSNYDLSLGIGLNF